MVTNFLSLSVFAAFVWPGFEKENVAVAILLCASTPHSIFSGSSTSAIGRQFSQTICVPIGDGQLFSVREMQRESERVRENSFGHASSCCAG